MEERGEPLQSKFVRKIRDPIYGYIPITGLEARVIDTSTFQRLDRLFQMPTARLVYPGAAHTRKSHSLGTMHLAHRAICSILYRQHTELRSAVKPLLYTGAPEEDEFYEGDVGPVLDDLSKVFPLPNEGDLSGLEDLVQRARLAGLLHDVGHGPFSHLFEQAFPHFEHQKMSARIVRDVLVKKDKALRRETAEFVADLLEDKLPREQRFLFDLISGVWGCDNLDYLVRDSYHAGTPEYGELDVERIIDGLVVCDKGAMGVREAELGAMLDGLYAMFSMYSSVYFHKTSKVFDQMVLDVFETRHAKFEAAVSDPRELLKHDDLKLMAARAMTPFANREKLYRVVGRQRLDFSLALLATSGYPEFKAKVKQIGARVKSCGLRLGVHLITHARPIRYVRIEPEAVMSWIKEVPIYRPGYPKTLELRETGVSEFVLLSRMNVPITVLAPSAQVADVTARRNVEKAVRKALLRAVNRLLQDFYGRFFREKFQPLA